jgi:cytochrome b subunit of formate dehydrogenase
MTGAVAPGGGVAVARAEQTLFLREQPARAGGRPDAPRERSGHAQGRGQAAPPRTDAGTMLLHWGTAITFLVSLFTGLRIAADNKDAVVSKWLTPILPYGEIWTWHFIAGLILFLFGSAYVLFMRRSGLARRAAMKKTRVLLLPAAPKLKFGAVNVMLHWALYGLVTVLTGTGIALYLGHGGWWVTVHSVAAFTSIGYLFAHIASHYAYGGLQQLLRIFRPAALVVTRATRPRPLLVGVACGVMVASGLAAADWITRDTLAIVRVTTAPALDGRLDDEAWMRAVPVRVQTQQGVNLGGSGESTVEVRAVHDGTKVYFAFTWSDPTRSLRRLPLIKREDGWHLLHDKADLADVNTFYEDKFAVLFADQHYLGGSGSTGFGAQPVAGKPRALHERGLHYTTDGAFMDMWQWKASRGGHLGHVDDQYFGPPREPTPAERAGKARYQGGYWNDPGRAFYSYNYKGEPPGGYRGPVQVQRLPKDWKATQAALGRFDLDPDSSDDENARWWMTEGETQPYSAAQDAAIPVGTVMPGVLIAGNYEGDRADVAGAARWKDGYWTLEASRKLATGSRYDKDFVAGRDLYMWVAVFDHTQTRHTRHARAVRVVLGP